MPPPGPIPKKEKGGTELPARPQKRKSGPSNPAKQFHKRAKIFDARTLAVQSSEAALSRTGELDVSAFVAAREYEIRSLEAGIRSAANALASRAFQKVPRSLRRRTASHNVKRVPRRLRARAKREMIEDNTPTVTARRRKPTVQLRLRLEAARRLQNFNVRTKAKRVAKQAAERKSALDTGAEHITNIAPRIPKIKKDKLSHPAKAVSKYSKRQVKKTWLPTHIYHAKRAHMTEPKAPLWRFAIPLTPTEKSYRPTHRANGTRGAIAWDMSYISTIGLEGVAASIEGLLKVMGVEGEAAWGNRGKKWRAGTRSLEAWLFERGGERLPIAPVTLIWCAREIPEDVEMSGTSGPLMPKKVPKQRLFLRVHPSAFLQLWEELLKVAKIQRPAVMLEDLRFEIGSIEVSGLGSTEALLSALKPIKKSGKAKKQQGEPEEVWRSLAGLTNPASLPQNALLAFNISDPRLRYPPRPIKLPNSDSSQNDMSILLSTWPPDATQSQPALFSRKARLTASRLLPSQKAINKRKSLAPPGEYPSAKETDSHIPIIVVATRPGGSSKCSNSQGRWTVLLPWKCVVPVWHSILFYPLSSGGNPRFGGLYEHQQLTFESSEAWFPGDFPATRAGWDWEIRQRILQKDLWQRKPKGKRIEFDSVDLGNGKRGEIGYGWACDWETLVGGKTLETGEVTDIEKAPKKVDSNTTPDKPEAAESKEYFLFETTQRPPFNIHHLSPSIALSILQKKVKSETISHALQSLIEKPALATVKLSLFNRGTPTPRARIYRLPTTDPALRMKWLSRLHEPSPSKSADKQSKPGPRRTGVFPLNSNSPSAHLPLPDEVDLIGFVTTGNYNLSAGKGTGVGAILVQKIEAYKPSSISVDDETHEKLKLSTKNMPKEKVSRTCIVRAPGENVGRLGWWEI